jgi:hypothetical protein
MYLSKTPTSSRKKKIEYLNNYGSIFKKTPACNDNVTGNVMWMHKSNIVSSGTVTSPLSETVGRALLLAKQEPIEDR